ncbi:DUF1315 domain-containing protein [Endozoicomonas sp. OPT23]|uniref:DUF1315 family protein n=1 Tax=Endozoicomonas sp. OPT23 TaxID=2072845 RepID=UPI00129BA806|nr:DUF1315 family protein [Endozoicomonas sp. OPT23]MRI35276.1 DUF1315 domain-containing protein [Endozoicomonas sp. OPT23]
MQFQDLLKQITPEIYSVMKESLELSRWPNGDKITPEQRDNTLQALIAWEHDNLPEEERIGYMPVSCKSSSKDAASEQKEPEATLLRFQ